MRLPVHLKSHCWAVRSRRFSSEGLETPLHSTLTCAVSDLCGFYGSDGKELRQLSAARPWMRSARPLSSIPITPSPTRGAHWHDGTARPSHQTGSSCRGSPRACVKTRTGLLSLHPI